MTQTLSTRPRSENFLTARPAGNFAANIGALRHAQGELLPELGEVAEGTEWVLARDGTLTALANGAWWGNCSLPARVAKYMFKSLEIRGVVGCFLFPTHAAQLRAALDKLEQHQAVLALIPDLQTLQIILHCEDFSPDIGAHRLWIAGGENWDQNLAKLLAQNPGLPTPADFIRAISADQTAADALIAPAQKIFADETTRRAREVQNILSAGHTETQAPTAICLVAPSEFRLWNDAPTTLEGILAGAEGVDCRVFDSDDPASSSPLALAMSASNSRAVITANLGRKDLPPVIRPDIPVVTWMTLPRIPEFERSSPRDALIVADPKWVERARTAGWNAGRIFVGTWPVAKASGTGDGPVVMIADTVAIVPPKAINEFSSHLILWDHIAAEIARDPSVVGTDVETYLAQRVKKLGIDRGAFDAVTFIERLILPAYQQSVARLLIAKGVKVRLYGKGWIEIEEFAPHAAGPVESREHLQIILATAGAVVHAWPVKWLHPIEATLLPVVRPGHLPAREDVAGIPALSPEIIRAALA